MKTAVYFAVFLLAFFSLDLVIAANPIVGVSPANVYFKNVLRGGYAERYITVSIDSDEAVLTTFVPRGNITGWLNFSNNVSISREHPGRILISVRPPSDIPNGNYSGFLRVSTESLNKNVEEGHAVGVVRAVIDMAITVEITDHEILECSASGFNVQSIEKGDDLIFTLNVFNNGNIRLNPDVVFNVWDQDQIEIVKTVTLKGSEILPTRQEILEFAIPTEDFDFDQYWVDIEVPECYASDTLTFDVYEPGALKAGGLLLGIIGKVWAEVDETIPLIATFKNTGEKNVDAQFEGRITKDGRIIQVLESEEQEVALGDVTNFTFFFTPERAGKYIVSGRVFYDKKRTFESSTVINVTPVAYSLYKILAYLALMAIIAFLYLKIRKEKRRYLSKVRQAGFRV